MSDGAVMLLAQAEQRLARSSLQRSPPSAAPVIHPPRDILRAFWRSPAATRMPTTSTRLHFDPAVPPPASPDRRAAAQVFQSGVTGQFDIKPPPGWTKKEWRAALQRAFGSRSNSFVAANVGRLLTACTPPGYVSPTSTTVSAALAIIEALEPVNEVQATVAVHIACVDAASGNLLSRMARDPGPMSTTIRSNAFAKLERAFTSLIALYQRLKYGNQQTIRIEKVEIQPGAQAVVGQVVSRK